MERSSEPASWPPPLSLRPAATKSSEGLKVKEIMVEGEQCILCHGEETAQKDRSTRERNLSRLETELAQLKQLRGPPHKKGACVLRAHQTLGRYLKQNKDGRLRINRSKVKQEEKLDGEYLLSTSDRSLPATDVALGWKKLSEVERAFRDLKQTLEVRPIYHRKEKRIRAHVILCRLALLLTSIAETETTKTWRLIRGEMERIHLGAFIGKAGCIHQRTEITPAQLSIFTALKLKEPPLIFDLKPRSAAARRLFSGFCVLTAQYSCDRLCVPTNCRTRATGSSHMTIIIVTYRLATLKNADIIYRLE